MTEAERLDFVIGQVASLKAFCAAIVATHPDVATLQSSFDRAGEWTEARMLPTGASEAMLDGITSMRTELQGIVASTLKHGSRL